VSAQREPGALLLTPKQRAIVEAVDALRGVEEWRQVFAEEGFEADMRDARDARDAPKMARAGVAFVTHIGAKEVADHLDRLHEQRAERGRVSALAREHNPRIKATRLLQALKDHEDATKTTITPESPASIRKDAAAKIGTSPSYLLRLLKDRAK
jgi:hypothetical protein